MGFRVPQLATKQVMARLENHSGSPGPVRGQTGNRQKENEISMEVPLNPYQKAAGKLCTKGL